MTCSSRGFEVPRSWFLQVVLLSLYYIHPNNVVVLVHGASFNSHPYIYSDPAEPANSSFPIMDHFAPSTKNDPHALFHDTPDFLYKPMNVHRVVEYYVHWCDICRHFKPHYIHLARTAQQLAAQHFSTSSSNPVTIEFHAISCHPNRPLCKKQNAKGFPIVRAYKAGTNTPIELPPTSVTPFSILKALGMPMSDMEEEEYEEWNLQEAVAQRDANAQKQYAAGGAGASASSWWRRLLPFGNSDSTSSSNTNTPVIHAINSGSKWHHRSREDLRKDIYLSLDFALRNSVFVSDDEPVLSLDHRKALKDFLKLVDTTMPVQWKEIHTLTKALLRNFRYLPKSERYLIGMLDKHIPEKYREEIKDGNNSSTKSIKNAAPRITQQWSEHCSYTCGLWSMFHAMTVGTVDYNTMMKGDPYRWLDPERVAKTIKIFIANFFGCQYCRAHFVGEYDRCEYNRCTRFNKEIVDPSTNQVVETKTEEDVWKELPLWLAENHNGVTVRLLKEAAERDHWKRPVTREDEIETLWPPRKHCHHCWRDITNEDTGEPDVEWDPDIVFKYMKLEYGRRDDATAEFRKELFEVSQSQHTEDYLPTHVSFYKQLFRGTNGDSASSDNSNASNKININGHNNLNNVIMNEEDQWIDATNLLIIYICTLAFAMFGGFYRHKYMKQKLNDLSERVMSLSGRSRHRTRNKLHVH